MVAPTANTQRFCTSTLGLDSFKSFILILTFDQYCDMHFEPIRCMQKHHNNINWSSHHHKFRIDWFIVLLVYWMRQYKNMQCATSGSKGTCHQSASPCSSGGPCDRPACPLQTRLAVICEAATYLLSKYLVTHIYLSKHTYLHI